MISYLSITFSIALITWLIATGSYRVRRHKSKQFHFAFTRRNYYWMMSPFILAILAICLINGTWQPLINFSILAIAGVIGELLFSAWWDTFFPKRFWIYGVDSLFNGYTSLLNFIPWGVGGLLFLSIIDYSRLQFNHPLINAFNNAPFYVPFGIVFIVTLFVTLLIAYRTRPRHKLRFELKEVNAKSYLLFCLPIILAILYLTVFYAVEYLAVAILFGFIAFAAEYLYGKACVLFISKRLWYYSYYTLDNNHTTVLNIIPFMAAGFYFWIIATIIFH